MREVALSNELESDLLYVWIYSLNALSVLAVLVKDPIVGDGFVVMMDNTAAHIGHHFFEWFVQPLNVVLFFFGVVGAGCVEVVEWKFDVFEDQLPKIV